MHDESVPDEVAADLQRQLDAFNAAAPALYNPMPLGANFRHLCLKARQAKMTGKGVSTAIDLKELYITSFDENGKPVLSEEGAEFAILVREGKCKSCKELARSKEGRVVRTADRPPVHGRVGRE